MFKYIYIYIDETKTRRYNSTTIVKKRREKEKKKRGGGEGLGCRGWGLSKGEVYAVGRAYA